jgi:hypothetical protein
MYIIFLINFQSIITDAMCIGGRCGWVGEERGALEAVEAALVHAAAPPLCLDPRPAVGLLAAKLHSAPRLFNTPRIRRQAKKFSQVYIFKFYYSMLFLIYGVGNVQVKQRHCII